MQQLKAHFQRILDTGAPKPNRKGEFDQPNSTISVFGAQLRFDLSNGTIPLTTSKELKLEAMAKEITWMLRGETNVNTLGCGIWDKWSLQENLGTRRPRPESDIIIDLSRLNPEKTVQEISKELFDIVVANTKIAIGTTITVPVAEGRENDVETVYLTKEMLTPYNISTEGVTTDYAKVDEAIHAMGVAVYDERIQYTKGECGPIYGKQWRAFESVALVEGGRRVVVTDQLMEAYRTLRDDIYSRRNLVSAWNPGLITESKHDLKTNIALGNMGLPPCHYGFQLYVAGKPGEEILSLGLRLRSSDSGVGLPFNIGSYAFIAYIYAAEFGLSLGDLVTDIGDAHIYLSHIDGIIEYIDRPVHDLPKFNFVEKYKELKERVCVKAINAYVDQLQYDSEEDRNAAADKELVKYFGKDVLETPAGKEALFKLFLDNIDHTVLLECVQDYTFEPFIKLDLYD